MLTMFTVIDQFDVPLNSATADSDAHKVHQAGLDLPAACYC